MADAGRDHADLDIPGTSVFRALWHRSSVVQALRRSPSRPRSSNRTCRSSRSSTTINSTRSHESQSPVRTPSWTQTVLRVGIDVSVGFFVTVTLLCSPTFGGPGYDTSAQQSSGPLMNNSAATTSRSSTTWSFSIPDTSTFNYFSQQITEQLQGVAAVHLVRGMRFSAFCGDRFPSLLELLDWQDLSFGLTQGHTMIL